MTRESRNFLSKILFLNWKRQSAPWNPEAPLDSIVSNYQRGVKLLRHCKTHLDNAELKIKEVSSDSKEKNHKETEDS